MTSRLVLLVGGSLDTETVLKTALRGRDVSVSRIRAGADPSRTDTPSLVVVENDESAWPDVPQVVVGRTRVSDAGLIDYARLVATVDRLLRT